MFQKLHCGNLFEDPQWECSRRFPLGMFWKIPTGYLLEHSPGDLSEDTHWECSGRSTRLCIFQNIPTDFLWEGEGGPPSVSKKNSTGEWEGEGVCTGERGEGVALKPNHELIEDTVEILYIRQNLI